jgi:3,4-dihydroxy-2-butanone 4-phosphate synthase
VTSNAIERVRQALDFIKAGKMVILVDDEDRENEGDLTMAAEMITPEAISFMATKGCGLICVTLTPERVDQLEQAHAEVLALERLTTGEGIPVPGLPFPDVPADRPAEREQP